VVYFVPTLWKRIIVLTAARTNCKDIRETYKVYKQFYENVDMIPCRRNRDFPALEMQRCEFGRTDRKAVVVYHSKFFTVIPKC